MRVGTKALRQQCAPHIVQGLERRLLGLGWGTQGRAGGDEVRGVCVENTPPPIFKISLCYKNKQEHRA